MWFGIIDWGTAFHNPLKHDSWKRKPVLIRLRRCLRNAIFGGMRLKLLKHRLCTKNWDEMMWILRLQAASAEHGRGCSGSSISIMNEDRRAVVNECIDRGVVLVIVWTMEVSS